MILRISVATGNPFKELHHMSDSATMVQKLWNYRSVLRDDLLEDADGLPPHDVIDAEIVEGLGAALAQFAEIAATLPRSETA